MADVETHRVVYTGPAPFLGLVVQTVSAEGLHVLTPQPDLEVFDVSEGLDQVTVSLLVTATSATAHASIAKVRQRLRGRGTVKLDDEDEDEGC